MALPEQDVSRPATSFADLQIHPAVLQAVDDVGYESPSAVQAATIPAMMARSDVVGLAQTGTGKTAAFAMPILSKIDTARTDTQALVLAPTRELALQVSEAFRRYGAHLPRINVLTIYGRWASPRTSNASSPTPPSTNRWRCSRRPYRRPSARSRRNICTTPSRSPSRRKRLRRRTFRSGISRGPG